MGLLDDLLARLRGTATEQASKAATAAAGAAAKKAVGDLAEDFLGFAEGELAEARAARGLDDEGDDTDGGEGEGLGAEAPPAVEQAPPPTARERREAAEAKAREELARLKALHGRADDDQQSS